MSEKGRVLICPKCNYKRTAQDNKYVSPAECPSCGIIYRKIKRIRSQQVDEPVNLKNRVLCGDGCCIGIIGKNGLCTECGKPQNEVAEKLINCKVCKKQVSINAVSCPHCGEPRKHMEQNNSSSLASPSLDQKNDRITNGMFCTECGKVINHKAKVCPQCGAKIRGKRFGGCLHWFGLAILIFVALGFLGNIAKIFSPSREIPVKKEMTKASQSTYNQNILKATTSKNLSKADLAWHAQNTYGWNCSEVVIKGEMIQNEYFIITCSNGTKLRVYPRAGKHPKIKNIDGTYK